jgi:hypothetical protein
MTTSIEDHTVKTKIIVLTTTVFLGLSLSLQASDIPEGWMLAGSNRAGYNFETDHVQGKPAPSGKISSNDQVKEGEFGTLMQVFMPKKYLGKRIELTAWVKSNNVDDWSGVWMRVDTDKKPGATFDNMQNRAISGTRDWAKYSVVLDVPTNAEKLSYGVLISGRGEIWFDEFLFSIVDESVPVTDMNASMLKSEPMNNSF